MVRILSAIFLIAIIGYLGWYFFENSSKAYFTNGAYRDMVNERCREVSEAFRNEKHPNHSKADMFMEVMAEERFNIANFKTKEPNAWQRLKKEYHTVCGGNQYLAPREIFMRVPRDKLFHIDDHKYDEPSGDI